MVGICTLHKHMNVEIGTEAALFPEKEYIKGIFFAVHALERQNTENLKQIFPEKESRGLSPNFHIHVSVSELYISTMGLPFLLEEICGPILGIYKSLTDT